MGLGGVATTLTKTYRVNASWDRVQLKGRLIVICFDANRQRNASVATAEARLVTALKIACARVRVADLPEGPRGAEGWGPDDYLASEGAEALLAVLSRAVEGDPLEEDYGPGSRKGYGRGGKAPGRRAVPGCRHRRWRARALERGTQARGTQSGQAAL